MGSKSRQTSTSHQENNPWAPAQPLLQRALGGISNYLDSPLAHQTYSGPTLAAQSDATRRGLGMMTAGRGADQSLDYMSRMVGGEFLNAENPHLQALQRSVSSSVMPGINATFSRAGMSGSTTHQGSLARGLGDAMAPHLFNQFESERGRQQQAAMALPGMEHARGQQLIGAGQMQEGYDQRVIDDARARFEAERIAGLRPYYETVDMIRGIGGMGGTQDGTSTTTTSQRPSTLGLIGGGLMTAAGLATGMPGLMSGLGSLGGMFGGGSAMNNPYNTGWANPLQRA